MSMENNNSSSAAVKKFKKECDASENENKSGCFRWFRKKAKVVRQTSTRLKNRILRKRDDPEPEVEPECAQYALSGFGTMLLAGG